MNIRLSPKLGLNPGLTVCPRCGGPSPELVLAGDAQLYQCKCGQKVVSHGYPPDPCPCGLPGKKADRHMTTFTRLRPFDGSQDKVLASEPCEDCKKQIEEHRAIVEAGGVYWRCVDCGSTGVIRSESPFAAMVRRKTGVPIPNPVGVEFSKEFNCPVCSQPAGTA